MRIMSGDRTSWLSKEAKVNGLFAAHLPRRRKNKVLPSSHAEPNGKLNAASASASQVKKQLEKAAERESEMLAYKKLVNEETRMKDKLMEALGKRCSEAEAKVEQVLVEKARIERELTSLRYSLKEQDRLEKQVAVALDAKAQAEACATEDQERVRALEHQLERVSKQLQVLQKHYEQEKSASQSHISQLEDSLHAHRNRLEQLEQQYLSEQQGFQEHQQHSVAAHHAQQELADRCDELAAENAQLLERLHTSVQENKGLRRTHAALHNRIENGEASIERTQKKEKSQVERIKAQERLLQEAEERAKAAEAKAERLGDQLKQSKNKCTFLVRKADQMQAKFTEKEKETEGLKIKVEEVNKKYRQAKERLKYMEFTLSQGGHKTNNNDDDDNNNNNNEDDQDNHGLAAVIPNTRAKAPKGGIKSRIPTAKPPTNGARGPHLLVAERTEDIQSLSTTKATKRAVGAARARCLPDPSTAADSDAPEWMKF